MIDLDNQEEIPENQEFPLLDDVWMSWDATLGRSWTHLNTLTVESDTMLYFYTALELRFTIESILFELLSKKKKGDIKKRDLKAYRPKDFNIILKTIDNEYLRTTKELLGFKIEEKDFNYIKKLYGKLGKYLHLPSEIFFSGNQESWKDSLEEIVLDAYEFLDNLTGNKMPS